MPSAAVVLNPTLAGDTIFGPGVATVLIGGKPACVLGDLHALPPPAPKPPGTFVVGSTTVLIGGRPAIRVTDKSSLGDSDAVGVPTVQIGG